MPVDRDLDEIRATLKPISQQADSLPWAHSRPWRPNTHLGVTEGLPMIDLHDLSVRLGLAVVQEVLQTALTTGGFVLITGRGNHTGGRSKLRDSVMADLQARAESGELTFRPLGPGRIEVVVAEDRVRAARPGMGLLFWLFIALLVAGIAATVWPR